MTRRALALHMSAAQTLRQMDYPLGSFPRFGHQERWAIERRQRAIENSIASRQAAAARRLMVEREVYLMLDEYVQKMQPKCPQTRAMADEIQKRMNRIKRKHNAGQRVYFRYLGETLQLFCRSTGTTDALEGLAPERLAQIAEDLGEEYYGKKFSAALPSDYNFQQPASNWWTDMPDGQKCFWFAAILLMILTILSRG
jgi:hypothetical protein